MVVVINLINGMIFEKKLKENGIENLVNKSILWFTFRKEG